MTDQGLYGQEVTDGAIVRHEPTPMELIHHAIDRGLDPEKLSALMDLQERHARNTAAEAYASALAEFQSKCPRIHKGRNVQAMGYSFASFDDIMRQVQPILRDCGLSVSFSTKLVADMMEVVCTIRHGIHSEPHGVTLPLPGGMKVNDTQKAGAALSYGKRYALCNALNIVVTDEDTDAAGLGETITEEQRITLDEMFEGFPNPADERKRFLAWKGIDTLADLPASAYAHCVTLVKNKLAKGGGR